MAYATFEQVKRMSPQLFNHTDPPKPDDVEQWINDGAAYIDGALEAKGYTTPAGSSADAYPLLRSANTFYAAAMAEFSRVVSTGREASTRAEILWKQFETLMKRIEKMDISNMGVTHQASVYIGGVSVSEKETVEDDTDRQRPAFRRGMHAYPGAGTTAARVPSDPQERSD